MQRKRNNYVFSKRLLRLASATSPDMRMWLEIRLKEIGRKKAELARHLNIPAPRVSEILSGRREIQADEIAPLASFLQWRIEDVIKADANPLSKNPVTNVGFETADRPLPKFGEKDVPIRGVAAGGVRGGFQMSGETIDYVARPPTLANSKTVYAIFVVNDSMAPAYEPGALVYVSPDRPARAGDYVIVQIHNGEDQVTEALFKRLKRMDDKQLVLIQYNPAGEIKLARKDVKAVHRVYTNNEIIGI